MVHLLHRLYGVDALGCFCNLNALFTAYFVSYIQVTV